MDEDAILQMMLNTDINLNTIAGDESDMGGLLDPLSILPVFGFNNNNNNNDDDDDDNDSTTDPYCELGGEIVPKTQQPSTSQREETQLFPSQHQQQHQHQQSTQQQKQTKIRKNTRPSKRERKKTTATTTTRKPRQCKKKALENRLSKSARDVSLSQKSLTNRLLSRSHSNINTASKKKTSLELQTNTEEEKKKEKKEEKKQNKLETQIYNDVESAKLMEEFNNTKPACLDKIHTDPKKNITSTKKQESPLANMRINIPNDAYHYALWGVDISKVVDCRTTKPVVGAENNPNTSKESNEITQCRVVDTHSNRSICTNDTMDGSNKDSEGDDDGDDNNSTPSPHTVSSTTTATIEKETMTTTIHQNITKHTQSLDNKCNILRKSWGNSFKDLLSNNTNHHNTICYTLNNPHIKDRIGFSENKEVAADLLDYGSFLNLSPINFSTLPDTDTQQLHCKNQTIVHNDRAKTQEIESPCVSLPVSPPSHPLIERNVLSDKHVDSTVHHTATRATAAVSPPPLPAPSHQTQQYHILSKSSKNIVNENQISIERIPKKKKTHIDPMTMKNTFLGVRKHNKKGRRNTNVRLDAMLKLYKKKREKNIIENRSDKRIQRTKTTTRTTTTTPPQQSFWDDDLNTFNILEFLSNNNNSIELDGSISGNCGDGMDMYSQEDRNMVSNSLDVNSNTFNISEFLNNELDVSISENRSDKVNIHSSHMMYPLDTVSRGQVNFKDTSKLSASGKREKKRKREKKPKLISIENFLKTDFTLFEKTQNHSPQQQQRVYFDHIANNNNEQTKRTMTTTTTTLPNTDFVPSWRKWFHYPTGPCPEIDFTLTHKRGGGGGVEHKKTTRNDKHSEEGGVKDNKSSRGVEKKNGVSKRSETMLLYTNTSNDEIIEEEEEEGGEFSAPTMSMDIVSNDTMSNTSNTIQNDNMDEDNENDNSSSSNSSSSTTSSSEEEEEETNQKQNMNTTIATSTLSEKCDSKTQQSLHPTNQNTDQDRSGGGVDSDIKKNTSPVASKKRKTPPGSEQKSVEKTLLSMINKYRDNAKRYKAKTGRDDYFTQLEGAWLSVYGDNLGNTAWSYDKDNLSKWPYNDVVALIKCLVEENVEIAGMISHDTDSNGKFIADEPERLGQKRVYVGQNIEFGPKSIYHID